MNKYISIVELFLLWLFFVECYDYGKTKMQKGFNVLKIPSKVTSPAGAFMIYFKKVEALEIKKRW